MGVSSNNNVLDNLFLIFLQKRRGDRRLCEYYNCDFLRRELISENTVKDSKYWSADPRRGEGRSINKCADWQLNDQIKKGTKASNELAILSLSPKIGPAVRHDQLSKSTTKLPELSAKPFGPPSARKTPLGSCQLNKIRSQSQIITKVTTKPVLFIYFRIYGRLFLLDMRYYYDTVVETY